jgi:hypothetical protein
MVINKEISYWHLEIINEEIHFSVSRREKARKKISLIILDFFFNFFFFIYFANIKLKSKRTEKKERKNKKMYQFSYVVHSLYLSF